jgi:hypothetical protein
MCSVGVPKTWMVISGPMRLAGLRTRRGVGVSSSGRGRARQGWRRLACRQFPAGVAQLAEQPSCKRQVSGSNPLTGSDARVAGPGMRPGGA